jgi:hypothetical protein
VWLAAIRSHAEIIGKKECDNMSSMQETLISEVFKRPVLWDHRIKHYHNKDFVDKDTE